jgi:hypothetical protein
MIFNYITSKKNQFFWTLFHVFLGFICTISPIVLIIWFYLVFFLSINNAVKSIKQNNFGNFLSPFFYLISLELLSRMAKVAPYIPSELGKYLLLLMSFLALFYTKVKWNLIIMSLIIVLPSLFIDLSERVKTSDIIFSWLGWTSALFALGVFYARSISIDVFNNILKIIWYSCLASLVFTFIRTPDLDEIEFTLNANSETSAQAASNQVSTILGLGMFLTYYSILKKLRFSGYRFLDLLIMILFFFQGLLSFSRGGVLVALLCMIIIYFYNRSSRKVNWGRFVFGFFASLLLLGFVFQKVDRLTDGKLFLRYQGETQGTQLGNKKKTADVFLSGRQTIFQEDIAVWLQSPLIGVGAGASRYMRKTTKYVAPHLELSRLAAESGILGLLSFYFVHLLLFKSFKKSLFKGVTLSLLVMASLTTFHAATRTFVSPVFFVLAGLQIIPKIDTKNETPIHRRNQYRALT